MSSALLDVMLSAALDASVTIAEIYARKFKSSAKLDGTPVTEADHAAEAIILAALKSTGIPVLAEEQAAGGHIPHLGNRFFCVDPLDGTREFLAHNGEFTVNIALIENGSPTLGAIVAPALGQAFVGSANGAFLHTITSGRPGPGKRLIADDTGPMRIVGSRSHGHRFMAELSRKLAVTEDVSVGSSLKFCLLARSDARLYPRFTETSEWDTAAGQAVLEAAGGAVVTLDGQPLTYGKASTRFINPFFVAATSEALARNAAQLMAEMELA